MPDYKYCVKVTRDDGSSWSRRWRSPGETNPLPALGAWSLPTWKTPSWSNGYWKQHMGIGYEYEPFPGVKIFQTYMPVFRTDIGPVYGSANRLGETPLQPMGIGSLDLWVRQIARAEGLRIEDAEWKVLKVDLASATVGSAGPAPDVIGGVIVAENGQRLALGYAPFTDGNSWRSHGIRECEVMFSGSKADAFAFIAANPL